jgi:hypothetical protein
MKTEIEKAREQLEDLLDHISVQQKRFERAVIWLRGTPANTPEELSAVIGVASQILRGEAISPNAYKIARRRDNHD